jgi:hypothetical protein
MLLKIIYVQYARGMGVGYRKFALVAYVNRNAVIGEIGWKQLHQYLEVALHLRG